MDIEQRLLSLERQNRHLRWTLLALLGLALTGCAMGLRPSRDDSSRRMLAADVIRAARLEVIGSHGQPIVVLSENRDATGGVVFVSNDRGCLVAQMGAADDRRGVVWAYDAQGEPRDDIR